MSVQHTPPILSVEGLRISLKGDEGRAEVLDRIDVTVPQGRIVGVVGESGCGKSTLIKAILRILPKNARIDSGAIIFEGEDLASLSEREMSRRIRGGGIGFIPQDPYLALNPVFRIGTQLGEILRWHAPPQFKADPRGRLVDLFRAVQLPDPEGALDRYPHQFSGGQRQRILIAAALACQPRLIVADEPTTALDVTTQQEILRLLRDLVAELGVSMLFVSHDFGVVSQLCDDISVIYAGQTAESGPTQRVLHDPRHPYTRMLIDCHPDRTDSLVGIPGTVPSPVRPPAGCRFAPRCPLAIDACRTVLPEPTRLAEGRRVVCWRHADPLPELELA